VELHPFRALHPPRELAARVACPPYDVLTAAEARAIGEAEARSFIHVIRPEIDLPDGASAEAMVAQAADALGAMVRDGTLVQDPAPAIWIYRQQMGQHIQVGFVGCANVEDYAQERIKRHEFTRKDKEDDRTRHVDRVSANTGPVFLTARHLEGVRELQASLMGGTPDLEMVGAHDVHHALWAIRRPEDLAQIDVCLSAVDAFYIADGHHRAASAMRVRDLRRTRNPDAPHDSHWERFLVVVFPAEQLDILAYNRLVHDLAGLEPATFLARVSEDFEVGSPDGMDRPTSRHSFAMYLDGAWRILTARPHIIDENDPVERLDVAILQRRLLDRVLGIGDPRTDKRIRFVGGIRGPGELKRLVDAGEGAVAFSLLPTSIEELLDVADAGQVMPPKSTWFEPKLASGLTIHLLKDM
jgi:uncharacterized protein (DUF1015 family)